MKDEKYLRSTWSNPSPQSDFAMRLNTRSLTSLLVAGVTALRVSVLARGTTGRLMSVETDGAESGIIQPTDLFSSWAEAGRDERMADGHRAPVADMLARADDYFPKQPFDFADVGCGNGWVARKMVQSGRASSAIGVDGAASMIDKARRITAAEIGTTDSTSSVLFFHSDLNAFAPPTPLDVVFSMEVLYYLRPDAVRTLLASIRSQWLKPGGIFVLGLDHYYENTQCHGWATLNNTYMLLWTEEQWREVRAHARCALHVCPRPFSFLASQSPMIHTLTYSLALHHTHPTTTDNGHRPWRAQASTWQSSSRQPRAWSGRAAH